MLPACKYEPPYACPSSLWPQNSGRSLAMHRRLTNWQLIFHLPFSGSSDTGHHDKDYPLSSVVCPLTRSRIDIIAASLWHWMTTESKSELCPLVNYTGLVQLSEPTLLWLSNGSRGQNGDGGLVVVSWGSMGQWRLKGEKDWANESPSFRGGFYVTSEIVIAKTLCTVNMHMHGRVWH